MCKVKLDDVCAVAEEAGARILDVYGRGTVAFETKADDSPLTAADLAAHQAIGEGLRRLYPDLPVLSEEGREIAFDVRRQWSRFFLVDPLDGTKEFLKRNGEFTVNIALIDEGRAVLGVVLAPALGTLYAGALGQGAWRREGSGPRVSIHVRTADPARGLTVVQSRSHPSPELDEHLKTLNIAKAVSVGSSLKFCAVAEGRADLYPRFGPTMEWDTAAGQSVLEAAGGEVADREGAPFRYNKPSLLNGSFIAQGRSRPSGEVA